MHRLNFRFAAKSLAVLLTMGLTTSAFAQSGASVNGTDQNTTIDCENGAATVSGVDNIVRITGNCSQLSVSGTDNRIRVDMASDGAITVNGVDNIIEWSSPGKAPRRAVSGVNNKVTQAK